MGGAPGCVCPPPPLSLAPLAPLAPPAPPAPSPRVAGTLCAFWISLTRTAMCTSCWSCTCQVPRVFFLFFFPGCVWACRRGVGPTCVASRPGRANVDGDCIGSWRSHPSHPVPSYVPHSALATVPRSLPHPRPAPSLPTPPLFTSTTSVSSGELFDKILTKTKFTETQAQGLFHQMVFGIHYLHSKGVAHRWSASLVVCACVCPCVCV
jgi:hypothetical protein